MKNYENYERAYFAVLDAVTRKVLNKETCSDPFLSEQAAKLISNVASMIAEESATTLEIMKGEFENAEKEAGDRTTEAALITECYDKSESQDDFMTVFDIYTDLEARFPYEDLEMKNVALALVKLGFTQGNYRPRYDRQVQRGFLLKVKVQ